MNSLEYRLYYDEHGKVLFYTCEKPEGNYIVINQQTYAEGRSDIKVVEGKIVKIFKKSLISKLVVSEEGTSCSTEDVSIISTEPNSKKWKLKLYED